MRVTSKGQVTIPHQYRLKYGLLPHMRIKFREKNGLLCIVKEEENIKASSRGAQIINRLRSAKINETLKNMSTEEIMEMTRGYRIDDK